MVIIKTPAQIEGIRQSSRLAAEALQYGLSLVKPGVSTLSINDKVHNFIVDHGAIPATLNYQGYPKSTCISINDIVCHGIPSANTILQEGDIVNLDVTTILNGYFGDTSATVGVGKISLAAQNLIDRTKTAMDLAIAACRPGKSINDAIGKTIEKYVVKFDYSPVHELGGHGVGLQFHEDPFVFHFDTPFNKVILRPGMIFTIEPMINASRDWHVEFDDADGWTVYTRDGSLSAQFEHTVLITDKGSEVLTKLN